MGRSAWIVVHPACQNMLLGAASPSVRLGARACLSAVLLELPSLGTFEPMVVALQRSIDRLEEGHREFSVL